MSLNARECAVRGSEARTSFLHQPPLAISRRNQPFPRPRRFLDGPAFEIHVSILYSLSLPDSLSRSHYLPHIISLSVPLSLVHLPPLATIQMVLTKQQQIFEPVFLII